MTGPERPESPAPVELTPREREVLAMVAEGKTNREIGAALFISESTAGVHVSNILAKLGLSSRTEAAAYAVRAAAAADSQPTPTTAPAVEATPDPLPEPAGFSARIGAWWRRQGRPARIAVVAVVILLAISAGLGYAVLTSEQPVAEASPTASASIDPSGSASASASPSASPSASASASALPSTSASAAPSIAATPVATPEPTPIPTPPGAWVATGTMVSERVRSAATILSDGSVLVTGGDDLVGGNFKRSAERYDPDLEVWSPAADMSGLRTEHSATLLESGRVLVVGGVGEESAPGLAPVFATAELFDPGTNRWSPTGSLKVARGRHTATLLDDGTVLVAGGSATANPFYNSTATGETYNPATGAWTSTGAMVHGHVQHTATLLRDGRVLVVGGTDSAGNPMKFAELYDPATRRWSAAASLAAFRTGHAAVRLANGSVLVMGGFDTFGTVATAEIYDPATNRWRQAAPMLTPRTSFSATPLGDGRVLVAGGWGGTDARDTSTTELYDAATDRWHSGPAMLEARVGHSSILLESGMVLVFAGEPSRSAMLFDPEGGG